MPQLVADIGATHARFALVQTDGLQLPPLVLPTTSFDSAQALLREACATLHYDGGNALLAVAGPLVGDQIRVTNTGMLFDAGELSSAVGSPVRLVNDFYALAAAVPDITDMTVIGQPPFQTHDALGVKAVLGPGSGLGMAAVLPSQTEQVTWTVLASEGGHADLAPGNHLEVELWQVLAMAHDHVNWETVLCGPGLLNLYRAMCEMWGVKPEERTPEQISQAGIAVEDPVCHQTLETFCALLGAAAGNFALTVTATGGVYLAGGILPALGDFVQTSPLRRRFEERGVYSEYVAGIPIYLVQDPYPGLRGAQTLLAQS